MVRVNSWICHADELMRGSVRLCLGRRLHLRCRRVIPWNPEREGLNHSMLRASGTASAARRSIPRCRAAHTLVRESGRSGRAVQALQLASSDGAPLRDRT